MKRLVIPLASNSFRSWGPAVSGENVGFVLGGCIDVQEIADVRRVGPKEKAEGNLLQSGRADMQI